MQLLTTLALLTPAALAQDLIPKAAPQARPVHIVDAVVHTIFGPTFPHGTVVFEDGRITAVHDSPLRPAEGADADVLEAAGAHLYPGFICVSTVMGLAEVASVDMTLDINEAGGFTPEALAAVAINPDSWNIPITRRNGVLTCGVFPGGGTLPGRAAVVRMDGWTSEDMALEPDAGLVLSWPRYPRDGDEEREREAAETIRRIDAFFDAAAAYASARAADPSTPMDLRFEALGPHLRGDKPLFVQAGELRQIEEAVAWARGRGLRPVIIGGRDAGLCTDLLVRADVPVAIVGTHRMPPRRDLSFATTYELPARLEAAGVRYAITLPASAWSTSDARNLPYHAAAAIAHGLSPESALRAVTLGAAECLDVADELGSIEPGKRATLFLASGDPFELSTHVTAAFIDGRRIVLEDKQTALDAKYREKYRQLGLLPDGN